MCNILKILKRLSGNGFPAHMPPGSLKEEFIMAKKVQAQEICLSEEAEAHLKELNRFSKLVVKSLSLFSEDELRLMKHRVFEVMESEKSYLNNCSRRIYAETIEEMVIWNQLYGSIDQELVYRDMLARNVTGVREKRRRKKDKPSVMVLLDQISEYSGI